MKAPPAQRRSRPARRGITIIEVLIVVTTVTMMLGLCAVSIQLLMRLNGDAVSRYATAVALERLARQIRDDAHSSESGQIDTEARTQGTTASLRLTIKPDRTVVYQAEDRAVVRTESAAGTVLRRESYSLLSGGMARFVLRAEGPSQFAVVVMTRSSGKSQSEPPHPLEVVAQIGKDRPLRGRENGRRHRDDRQKDRPAVSRVNRDCGARLPYHYHARERRLAQDRSGPARAGASS